MWPFKKREVLPHYGMNFEGHKSFGAVNSCYFKNPQSQTSIYINVELPKGCKISSIGMTYWKDDILVSTSILERKLREENKFKGEIRDFQTMASWKDIKKIHPRWSEKRCRKEYTDLYRSKTS